MRKICYSVATSLDGFIAGPNGETDWIVMAPEVDFSALWARFDTLLMGRRTYEAASQRFGTTGFQGQTRPGRIENMAQQRSPRHHFAA